jgi:hypothetical protein
MSFQAELCAAAQALARLALHGTSTLTDAELDLALYARATVIDVARRMCRDVTGIAPTLLEPRIADLEAHPVQALYRALRTHQPIPAVTAPSDVLAIDAPNPAGRLWKDVARHSLQAHHLWQTGTLGRPAPDVAWAGIGDVAALAGVVAELDSELAVAAGALPGRARHAEKLAKAVTSGLRTAAREVAVLADSGPLAVTGPEPLPVPRREVVPVLSPQHAIRAQQQLASLLRSASHLRPERVALITLGHQRTFAAVMESWRQTGASVDRDLRGAVHHHLGLLTEATGRRWRAASLDGGDPYPLHQAHLLRQELQPGRPILCGLLADATLTSRLVEALADTSAALAEATDAHLRRHEWLRPIADGRGLVWVPVKSWDDVPPATQALRAAGVHAAVLRGATVSRWQVYERLVGSPAPGHTPAAPRRAQSARHALAPAPHLPLLPQIIAGRPLRPGIPPRPAAATYVTRRTRR